MMSPSIALHDRVFLTYLALVPATFIIAGVVLILVQLGVRKNLGQIWDTYRSWWVMGAIALAVVFLGRIAIVFGVASLGALAFRELVRASALKRYPITSAIVTLSIAGVILTALVPEGAAAGLRMSRQVLCSGISLAIVLALFLVPILRGRWENAVDHAGLAFIGFTFLGCLFGQLSLFTTLPHAYGFLCYVIFATEVNDVAAFTFGRTFGRHFLCPKISPRKTWEGAIGALAVSLALPWAFRFSLPMFGPVQLLLTGLIIGIGGQLGDLAVSVIKRKLGTKDMGDVIAGHGGILDRIDSLIFVAPLFMQLAAPYDMSR
jgi:phosphatidate cytidylyltransferase